MYKIKISVKILTDIWNNNENKTPQKFVHESQYVAEVDVDLIETNEGWSPYLSLEDAFKLNKVREALCNEDIESALWLARIFKLTLLSAATQPKIKPCDDNLLKKAQTITGLDCKVISVLNLIQEVVK